MAELKQENAIQRDAFEFYYGLGDQRSLKAVAIQFKRSERTIASWSRAFSWVDRCTQRALDEAEGKEKQSMVLDIKTTYRKLFNNLIAVAVKDFKEGRLKIKNINDLEKVVKMDLALIDNPIDNMVSGEVSLSPDDKKAVDSLMKEIKAGLNSLRD